MTVHWFEALFLEWSKTHAVEPTIISIISKYCTTYSWDSLDKDNKFVIDLGSEFQDIGYQSSPNTIINIQQKTLTIYSDNTTNHVLK